jgi:hypothetical protein
MRIAYSYQGRKREKDFEQAIIIIGRPTDEGVRPELDLSPDTLVTRSHAQIRVEDGRYWIKDLGSKYGTVVNGEDIRGKGEVALAPGVTAQMGETMLAIVADKEDAKPARIREGSSAKKKDMEPAPLPRLRATVNCLPAINYSLVHADAPLLSEIALYNETDTSLTNLELRLTLPGYAESQPVTIPFIPARGSHTIYPLPRFHFERRELQALPEPVTARLAVWVNGERAQLNQQGEVKILPPNAWRFVGHEAALAGFVMPNSDAVIEVVSRACFYLRRLMNGVESFADALDSTDPKRVEKMVIAIYYCLQERYRIRYEYEPRTYDADWQMIRFPHEVLDQLKGTCIDLALLFASCLESVFLNPIIIIIKTAPMTQHALIGCWRSDNPPQQSVILNGSQAQQWAKNGDLILLDSVGFAYGKSAEQTFPGCRRRGARYLKLACARRRDYRFQYALNIIAARYEDKIMPMPFGKGAQFDRSAWLAISRARREAETLQSPFVGARHLLLGLLSLEDGLLRQLCAKLRVDLADEITKLTRATFPRSGRTQHALPEGEDWQAVMQRAEEIAMQESKLLVTECVLARALLETPTQVNRVLARVGLQREQCLDELRAICGEWLVRSAWRSSDFTM